jgi:hypothetical protein
MGTDIHCYLEAYNEAINKWECSYIEKDYDGSIRPKDFYGDQNYWLFAWLGCTHRRPFVPPINPCRGFPSDASDILANYKAIWAADGHSHSYFTFHELMMFLDLDVICKVFIEKTFMDYIRRDKVDFRESEWGSHFTTSLETRRNPQDYEEVTFIEPTDGFMKEFKDLVKKEVLFYKDLNRVRIVFWFDN